MAAGSLAIISVQDSNATEAGVRKISPASEENKLLLKSFPEHPTQQLPFKYQKKWIIVIILAVYAFIK